MIETSSNQHIVNLQGNYNLEGLIERPFARRPNTELEKQLQPEKSGVTTYNNVDSSNIMN